MKTIALLLALFVAQPSKSSPDSLASKPITETLSTDTVLIQLKEAVELPFELVQQIGIDVVPVRLQLQSDGRIKVQSLNTESAYADMQLRKALEKVQLMVPNGFQQMEIEFNLRVQI